MSLYTVRWLCPVEGKRKRRDFHSRRDAHNFLGLPRNLPLQEVEVRSHG